MPEIKLQHVVSVSSEDKNYPAENLVKCEGFKKWKSKTSGEKQVTATFQLEKASKIDKIDIGNEGAAFVEVLVGKASAKDADFQVILVASSFMNPSESRSNQNATRVRMFGSDQLSKAVLDDNWDLVKVVCTQPFNKSIQYGLSFIKFHSAGGSTASTEKETSFGLFKVKSDASEDIKPGSLFAARGKETVPPPAPLTGAAAARAASRLAEETKPSEPAASVPVPKRKHSDNGQVKTSPAPDPSPKTPLRKQSTSLSSTSSGGHSASHRKPDDARPPLKKMKTEPPKPSKEKEFSKLMDRVTFVLSGFQNPERAKLRDRAIEMGATYKGDWGKGCTHLICAFENTPKYNQVKGKGRIVKKDFVRDCYKQRKLLPWRDYRLGKARSPPPSSDEDSDSGDERPTSKKAPDTSKKTPSKPSKSAAAMSDSDDDYGASTDEGDTDDEIQRATAPKTKASPAQKLAGDDDVPSTGEEKNGDVGPDGLPVLPDFFSGKRFLLYGKYPALQRRTLNRFIVAYNGSVEEYMGENINYVITDSEWDKNFDDALSESPQLVFVKSDWIHACDEKQKIVPHQKYNIVPK